MDGLWFAKQEAIVSTITRANPGQWQLPVRSRSTWAPRPNEAFAGRRGWS